ncbi:MAG: hypothetical protein ACTSRI_04655 [Promethearchaeota archaeon]
MDVQIEQLKQCRKISKTLTVDGQRINYRIQDLGAGWPCFAFQDYNSTKILIFGYLHNLDDFYVDGELIVPFERSDGKKANFIYYKIPTPNNLTYKFFSLVKDAEFIIRKVEEHNIL